MTNQNNVSIENKAEASGNQALQVNVKMQNG
jgi:hypothetical protein